MMDQRTDPERFVNSAKNVIQGLRSYIKIIRVFQKLLLIQVDPDSRTVRNHHAAVFQRQALVADFRAPGNIGHHHFQHDEVRNTGRELKRGRVRDRSGGIMRAESDMAALRLGTQHPHFHDAARVRDVRLNVVGTVQIEESPVFIAVVETFSCCNGDAHTLLDFAQPLLVVGRNRLLEPEDVKLLQLR